MEVHHAEFLLEQVAVGALGIERIGGGPAFGLQSGISDAGADRGSEPFSGVDVQRRSQPFAEFTLRIVLAEIEVHTAGDADENIVEQPVGFVRAAHDAALRIAVFFLLRLRSEAGKQEEGKKAKVFHVQMFCNELIV